MALRCLFLVSPIYTGEREPRKCVSGMADKWALSAGHLHDIGEAIFELLFTICIIADYTKNKLRDRIDEYCCFILTLFFVGSLMKQFMIN